MKKVIALSLVIVVSASGMAQAKTKVPKEISCAVMAGSKVDIKKATSTKMFADYKGRRYFFCCAGCPEAFKKNPAKFAKAPSIKTPKAK